jgi:DNA-binding NarL/FixJ family response regulator
MWGVNDGHRTMQRLRSAQAAFDAAAARAEARREERNIAVREALAAGLTHAEIARATGLSRGRIGQIAHGGA